MEESPEQVLARLVRYRDSLNRTPAQPADAAQVTVLRRRTADPERVAVGVGAGFGAPASGTEFLPAPDLDHAYPAESSWRRARSAVGATVLGQFIAVVACAAAVVAFERLDTTVALTVVGAAALVGLIAAARRAPFAVWWTIGVVIGGMLGRWS